MSKNSLKTFSLYTILVVGLISSSCVRETSNTAQNTPPNKKSEQSTVGGINAGDPKNSIVESTENSNAAAKTDAAFAPNKEQKQQTIDKYIAGVAKVSEAEEYKEARKVFDGDLDGDGDEDAAAQFTIEGMGGGNNYGFYLAVFKNDNGKYTAVTDEVIGGKMNRAIEFTKIENGTMFFDTKDYAKDDGACCPSIAGKTSYVLEGNKIVEKKLK